MDPDQPAKKEERNAPIYCVWNSDFGVPSFQNWREMIICLENLSEFRYRNEMEFQSGTDLSELRLSFQKRSCSKPE